jgi:integrase
MRRDEIVDRKSGGFHKGPRGQRAVGRLNAALVRNAKPGPGKRELKLADGGNLFLLARRAEAGHITRRWQFEFELRGKRRWMGLGGVHTLNLKEARAKARTLRQQLLEGIDPLEAKEAAEKARLAEQARVVTFRKCAELYLALHQDNWSFRHRQQWYGTLRDYINPVLGGMSVADIDEPVILKIIEPLWQPMNVTAGRILSRIEAVLDYASAAGARHGDNPARALRAILPKSSKTHRVAHHAAVSFPDAPAFMAELRKQESVAARCLEFTVLTAARSGESIGALWSDIDLKTKTWTVPRERMKSRREHRIPLSARAIAILRALPQHGDRVFPKFHNTALSDVLARLRPGTTVHGFRSCFKDWSRETTNFADSVVEAALAHVVGDKVMQAYARGTLFDRRRELMNAWSAYCEQPSATPDDAKVVAIGGQRK